MEYGTRHQTQVGMELTQSGYKVGSKLILNLRQSTRTANYFIAKPTKQWQSWFVSTGWNNKMESSHVAHALSMVDAWGTDAR
jgi:hypothetical protein